MWTDTLGPGPLNLESALRLWGPARPLRQRSRVADIQPFVNLMEGAGLSGADKVKIHEGKPRELFRIR